jgi:hypothetical protein
MFPRGRRRFPVVVPQAAEDGDLLAASAKGRVDGQLLIVLAEIADKPK